MSRDGRALGLLEVRGMTAAIGAADAMAKAAYVAVGPPSLIGDGLVTIPVLGDIAAAREAVTSGAAAAARIGELVARHVIGRPAEGLIDVFGLGVHLEVVAEPPRESARSEGMPSRDR